MTVVPLRRNRDFVMFQSGQLLSDLGSQSSSIAYPLLVLALTQSAAKAGVVSFARVLPLALLAIPAGLLADRWNRKRLMIAADCVRVVAVGALAILILTDHLTFWELPIVAFVEGGGSALFSAAQAGAMRAVIPAQQVPDAVAAQTGRRATVQVAGPAFGGALFGIAQALPFGVDAVSYAFSTVSMLWMRTPFQQQRERDRSPVRDRLTEGFHYLWGKPFLRSCVLLFSLANFIIPGLLFTVVVLADRDGLAGGRVGALVAVIGASVLLGSAASPLVRRVLPVRGVLLLELWTYVDCAIFLIWPSVYVLVGCLIPTALAIASTNSVVHGYRIAMTPDRLLGRVESVWTSTAVALAPLGPLLAGALLTVATPRVTVGLFATAGLVLAVWGTLSPSIRAAPSLDDLCEVQSVATSP